MCQFVAKDILVLTLKTLAFLKLTNARRKMGLFPVTLSNMQINIIKEINNSPLYYFTFLSISHYIPL